ncbi:MAG: hypothetical protein JXQ90_19015 [Cyclobacteriaceae bacterium]
MLVKIVLVSVVFITVIFETQAQTDQETDLPKNNIGLSIAGQGSWYALNYERLYRLKNSDFVSAGIGIGKAEEDKWCMGPC